MTPLRKKRRKEILAAAFEVFAVEGFHKGTISQIADVAGIGKGTVYEYFTSKQEIFESMLVEGLNNYISKLENRIKNLESFEARLRELIVFNMDFLEKNNDFLERLFFGLDESSKEIMPNIMDFHTRLYEFFLSLVSFGMENGEIDKSKDKTTLTIMLINVVYGLGNSSKVFNLNTQPKIDDIINIVFEGIRKR